MLGRPACAAPQNVIGVRGIQVETERTNSACIGVELPWSERQSLHLIDGMESALTLILPAGQKCRKKGRSATETPRKRMPKPKELPMGLFWVSAGYIRSSVPPTDDRPDHGESERRESLNQLAKQTEGGRSR